MFDNGNKILNSFNSEITNLTRREEIGMCFQEALLNDLTQSCGNFEKDILFAEQGFEFTEASAYFLMQFSDQLRFGVDMALDAVEKGQLLEVGKTLAVGAVQASTANYLLGNSKAGIVFQGVNAALIASLALKEMNDISRVKDRAENILVFLADTDKKAPGKMVERLAIRFWQKFRLHIELLRRGKDGSDVLIEYLTTQIINSIMTAPKSMVIRDREGTLNFIYTEIIKGKDGIIFSKSIPKTKMLTHTNDLGWNLKELIQHSPRIRITSYSMLGSSLPLFKLETYYCELEKYRNLRKVSADDSHKYPAVMIIDQSEIDRLPNFKLDKQYELKLPSDSKRNKNKYLIETTLYCQLYERVGNVKRRRESSNITFDLIELMTLFNIFSESLLQSIENLRQASWLYAVVELINLVNIYDKYIDETIKNSPYIREHYQINKRFVNLAKLAEANAELMRNLFTADKQSIIKRAEGAKLKSQFYQTAKMAPSIRFSEVHRQQFSILQATTQIKKWQELDYTKDDGVLVRYNKCRINDNLKSILGSTYNFYNLRGECVSNAILNHEKCDNYNASLNLYLSSMQKQDYIIALYALMSTIYYFTFGIDDQMVFIQKDMGLIEQIKSICGDLTVEYDTVVNEIFSVGGIEHLKGYIKERGDDDALKMSIILERSLKETIRLYNTCQEIRDEKTLHEKFSELSKTEKVIAGLVGGVVFGGMVYYAYQTCKNTSKENESIKEESKTKSNWLSSTISGLAGAVIAGGIIVANDVYCKNVATKRVIRKMLSENSPLNRMIKDPNLILSQQNLAQDTQNDPGQGLNHGDTKREKHSRKIRSDKQQDHAEQPFYRNCLVM